MTIEGRNYRRLRERGVRTKAVVTRRDKGRGDLKDWWDIDLTFEVDGKTYTEIRYFSQSRHPTLHEGRVYEIVYLPENPKIFSEINNDVLSQGGIRTDLWLMRVVTVIGLVLIIYGFI